MTRSVVLDRVDCCNAGTAVRTYAVRRLANRDDAILTSVSDDFSGQKWTDRKSSGGQNGWGHTSDANSEFTRKLWRAKKFRAVSSVVERLVRQRRTSEMLYVPATDAGR